MMAAAATMLAACTQTDIVQEVNTQQAIGFETFAGKATRHMSSTALNDFHQTFGVYGWENDNNFMLNYKASYDGTTIWDYDSETGQDLKYWDNSAVYQFHAVAPYNANVTCTKAGVVTIPEAANATAATQNLQTGISTSLTESAFSTDTDWLYASEKDYKMTDGETVGFAFSHMMSKLVVAVQKQGTEAIKITSVTVKGNIYSKATFNGTVWAGNTIVDLAGRTGTVSGENTPNYVMEYLIVPTAAANLTFSMEYTVNDVPKSVTDVAVTGITEFAAGTYYTLNANIGLAPIQFSASLTPWTEPGTPGSVTVQQ